MKKLILLAIIIAAAMLPQSAISGANPFTPFWNVSTVRFSIVSTAVPSAANIRIGAMIGRLPKDQNQVIMMTAAWNAFKDYLVTKTLNVSVKGVEDYFIEVDQDTKMYLNNGTDYIVILSGTRFENGKVKQ